ncbi:syntaphilin [Polymixia lowei]
MSAPAPANRRSASGSHRFNPLKVLQPKRRLQQMPASSPVPVPKPAFDYCRFIELDYVPMETGCMVSMRPTKGYASTKSPTKGYASTKRTPAQPSNRDPYGNTSLSSSSNSGSCKGSDCSPTKGVRHQKYTSCTDNHGIRPPPPEQYLTPLQQKEVCIRHLRARLKETIDRLQDRDTEIDELRGQLSRMQEDWVEEECHRVEAQLALKEARREIQQLKHAVDTVRASLSEAGGLSGDGGVQKYFQDINTQNHKLENLLLSMELAQTGVAKEGEIIPGCRIRVGGSAPASVSGESPGGMPKPVIGGRGSCSCDGSPARSLTRSSTYTKLSDQALADRNGNGPDFPCLSGEGTQDSGFVCCGESHVPSRADLLLEAAFLSEETASLLNSYAQTLPHSLPNSLPHTLSHTLPHSLSHNLSHTLPHTVPHSSTYEKLCTGDRLAPLRCALGGVGSVSHPCLSHHHLYLHHLRETGIQTESCPVVATAGYPSDLDTIAEQRTFRSQACSPTSTWMSDEGEEELDSITTTTSVTTATIMTTATEPIPVSKTPVSKAEEAEEPDSEEAQQCQVDAAGCSPGESQEEAAPGTQEDSTESTAGRQGEPGLGGCTGDGTQEEIKLEEPCGGKRPQAVGLSVVSTQVETAEVNPSSPGMSPGAERPHTSQPRRSASHEEIAGVTVVVCDEDDDEDETNELGATGGTEEEEEEEGGPSSTSGSGPVQKSYWSRHFLVDLLAVAVPVVPTVAWLCRGPVRNGQPMYHIGSLLRGCCTVALHSLRRGGGLRHYPAGGGDLGGTQI